MTRLSPRPKTHPWKIAGKLSPSKKAMGTQDADHILFEGATDLRMAKHKKQTVHFPGKRRPK